MFDSLKEEFFGSHWAEDDMEPAEADLEQTASFVVGLCLCKPTCFQDAEKIVQLIRQRKRVVLTFEQLSQAERQRVMDYVAGAAMALDDRMTPISAGSVLITRAHDELQGYDEDSLNTDAATDACLPRFA